MALERLYPKEVPPPVDDSWRPRHKAHKKLFGLVFFRRGRSGFTSLWNRPSGCGEMTVWYETERARNDAIISGNNKAAGDRYYPVVAMGKINR